MKKESPRSTTEGTSGPVLIQATEPKDIAATLTLRRIIADFAAASAVRPELTDDDDKSLEQAAATAAEFSVMRFDPDLTGVAKSIETLVNAVNAFVRTNRGSETRTVAGVSFVVSALKTPEIREHLADTGAQIVSMIDAYVADRRARMAREAARNEQDDKTLEAARKLGVLMHALRLYEEAYELSRGEGSAWGITTGMTDGASRAIDAALAIPGYKKQLGENISGAGLRATIERQVKERINRLKAA